jgi:hypothetical protein
MRPIFRATLPLALLLALAACKGQPDAAAAGSKDAAATAVTPAPAAVVADARAEVKAAMEKVLAARSFHATMRIKGGAQGMMINEMDFVAPDRYRIAMPNVGTQTVIGDTMYMSMHGRTAKVPMPKGTLTQWRDPARMAENEATMTVTAQGTDTVGTEPSRKYLIHHTQPQPIDVLMWVGNDGRPLQLEVSSTMQGSKVETSVRYSHYDDPSIVIDAPK